MSNDFSEFLKLIQPKLSFEESIHPPNQIIQTNIIGLQHLILKDNNFMFLIQNEIKKNNDVDVFYIHPTGFYETSWNSDMDKAKSAYERTEIMLGNQASAFNGSCNIYAPEYRQAHISHFLIKKIMVKKL